jgi:hypothetical protein
MRQTLRAEAVPVERESADLARFPVAGRHRVQVTACYSDEIVADVGDSSRELPGHAETSLSSALLNRAGASRTSVMAWASSAVELTT